MSFARVLPQFRASYRRISCEPPLRPARACPPAPVVHSSESHPSWSPTVNRVKPCAPRGTLWNWGSPIRLSEFTRSSHTRLPKRRAHDYALPLARRANRQLPPCSTVPCRSFPHAPLHNYQLPLALRANRHAACRHCLFAVAREPVCDPRVSVKVLVVARIAAPHAAHAKYAHHHCCSRAPPRSPCGQAMASGSSPWGT